MLSSFVIIFHLFFVLFLFRDSFFLSSDLFSFFLLEVFIFLIILFLLDFLSCSKSFLFHFEIFSLQNKLTLLYSVSFFLFFGRYSFFPFFFFSKILLWVFEYVFFFPFLRYFLSCFSFLSKILLLDLTIFFFLCSQRFSFISLFSRYVCSFL